MYKEKQMKKEKIQLLTQVQKYSATCKLELHFCPKHKPNQQTIGTQWKIDAQNNMKVNAKSLYK